jgi:hypothetical protein
LKKAAKKQNSPCNIPIQDLGFADNKYPEGEIQLYKTKSDSEEKKVSDALMESMLNEVREAAEVIASFCTSSVCEFAYFSVVFVAIFCFRLIGRFAVIFRSGCDPDYLSLTLQSKSCMMNICYWCFLIFWLPGELKTEPKN